MIRCSATTPRSSLARQGLRTAPRCSCTIPGCPGFRRYVERGPGAPVSAGAGSSGPRASSGRGTSMLGTGSRLVSHSSRSDRYPDGGVGLGVPGDRDGVGARVRSIHHSLGPSVACRCRVPVNPFAVSAVSEFSGASRPGRNRSGTPRCRPPRRRRPAAGAAGSAEAGGVLGVPAVDRQFDRQPPTPPAGPLSPRLENVQVGAVGVGGGEDVQGAVQVGRSTARQLNCGPWPRDLAVAAGTRSTGGDDGGHPGQDSAHVADQWAASQPGQWGIGPRPVGFGGREQVPAVGAGHGGQIEFGHAGDSHHRQSQAPADQRHERSAT